MSATTILCWLNASKTEGNNTLRLVPQVPTSFLPDGKCVFINMKDKQVKQLIADAIRKTYETHSYSFMLDLSKVTMRTSGFSVEMDSATLKAGVTKTEKTVKTEMTDDDRELLAVFGVSSDDDITEDF